MHFCQLFPFVTPATQCTLQRLMSRHEYSSLKCINLKRHSGNFNILFGINCTCLQTPCLFKSVFKRDVWADFGKKSWQNLFKNAVEINIFAHKLCCRENTLCFMICHNNFNLKTFLHAPKRHWHASGMQRMHFHSYYFLFHAYPKRVPLFFGVSDSPVC